MLRLPPPTLLRLLLALFVCVARPVLATPPAAPSNLEVILTKFSQSASNPHTYVFLWNDGSSDESGFEINYRVGTSGAFSLLNIGTIAANQTGTAVSLSALANGTTIQFMIRAYKGPPAAPTEYSAGSNIFTVTIPATTFAAPTGVTGTLVSDTVIKVAWTDASTSEDGVELWMAQQPGGAFSKLGDILFYQTQQINVSQLLPGVGYQFKLRAYRNGTPRTYTAFSVDSPPAAPTGLSASGVGKTSLTLSWTDNSPTETSYEILSRPTGAGAGAFTVHQIAAANATGATVTNLTPGVSLDFAVRARADYTAPPGLSANSNVVTQLMKDVINSPHYAQVYVGQPFTYTLATTTGSALVSANISGLLPSGLTLDGTSMITGRPDTPGVTLATMSATFADGSSDSPGLAIRVLNPPVVASVISPQTVVTGTPLTVPLSGAFNDPEASSAVKVVTTLGTMNFILFATAKPLTVANFMSYVNSGGYNNNLFHRSVPGFVIQGGAFKPAAAPNEFTGVPKFSPVVNEPGISSIRGTIAMAKLPGDPNSATEEFFVNLENNGAILDGQNGGFTVFGRVAAGGMGVADAIALKPTGTYLLAVDGTPRSMTEWPVNSPGALPLMDNTKVVGITSVTPLSVFSYAITSNTNAGAVSAAISGGNLILTPVASGTANITVRATNLDGYTVSQTFAVTTRSNVATLSKLALGSGALSPVFSSGTTNYTLTVPNTTTSFSLTPTLTHPQATVKVNGVPVAFGGSSSAIPLLAGSNPIIVLVTAEDGVTTKSYAVNVTRTAVAALVTTLPATGALTTGVTLNGTVNPKGASTTTSFDYGTTTAYGGSIAATPSPVTGSSATAASAVLGGLTPGTTYHYRLKGSSAAGPALGTDMTFTTKSTVATLSNLVLSAGTLSPAFSSASAAFAATVPNGTTAITVTPTLSQAQASVQVNGAVVPSGKASGAIILAPGANTISILVTAQDGLTTKNLALTVTRAPAPVVTTLAATNIGATSATFNGTVNAGGASTTVSFEYGTTMSYGLTVTGAPASVSGTAGTSVSATLAGLAPGAAYHYRIKGVNLAGTALGADASFTTPINLATLSGLGLSEGMLSPAFASATTAYTATVSNATASLTVTPTSSDAANTTVTVNGVPVTSGSASSAIDLNVGANTISIVGTARDGTTTKTYTIKVTRSAALASLTTQSASGVGATVATLNGLVNTANSASTTVSFDYGLTTSYGSTVAGAPASVGGTAGTSVSATLAGLTPGKTYHYRIRGVNLAGAATEADMMFTTKSNVATLSGLVLSSGALSPAFASATTSYTRTESGETTSLTATPTPSDPNATVTVALNNVIVSGAIALSPGLNTITVQVKAQDGVTTKTYTLSVTRTASPVVATLPATSVTAVGAKLNGTINALNTNTTVSFAYGLNAPAYSSSVAAMPSPVTGNSSTAVSATLTGLLPGRTYHYQVRALSLGVTTPGADATFTTPGNVATLSGLALGAGTTLSPAFASATTAYTATVSNATASLTVTPTLSDVTNATVTVNGVAVASGSASGAIDLSVGANTITIVGTAQDGTTKKTYTLKVTRSAALASLTTQAASGVGATVATLNGLVNTANSASTTVSFDYGLTTSYGSTVAGAPASVGGTAGTSVSATLAGLTPGKTYHYRIRGVNLAGPALGADLTFITPSNVATLSGLVLGSRALSPAFAAATTSYTQTVPNATASLTIKPTATSAAATLLINGVAVTSGSTTGAIALSAGLNTFAVQVTAQDGVTKKTYSVSVTRLESPVVLTIAATNVTAVGAKLNGALNALNSSTVVSFEYGTTLSYGKSAVATPSPVTGMAATAASATLTGLLPGKTYHYRIKAVSAGGTSRGEDVTFPTPNNVATLSGLVLGAGTTLSPVFASATTAYTATVDNATDSLTATPALSDANATVTVNDVTVTSGSASGVVALSPGINTIRVVGTAQDGVTTRRYTVMVTRRAPPVVVTLGATNVTAVGVKLNGTVNALNTSTAASFVYGLSAPDYGKSAVATPTPVTGSAATAVSATLTGLLPGRTYHYQLKGESAGGGPSLGADETFTTPNNVATLSGLALSDPALNPVTLSPAFSAATTAYTATVNNATASIAVTPSMSDAGATVKVNGLAVTPGSPSAPVALNVGANTITIVGTAEDGVATKTCTVKVTRAAFAPAMTTLAASGVSATSATVNGTANANNASTAVSFDYGLTTAYGSSAVATSSPLSGGTATPVSAVLNGLQPGATYHYRIRGVNLAGPAWGTDMMFTTKSNVATLSGLVLSSGALSPAFASATTSYTQTVLNATPSLTVKPTATSAVATLKLNGADITSGSTSGVIDLLPGLNTIIVLATAQDGATTMSYTVNVTRPTPPPTVVTLHAGGVTATGATVHGTANAQGTAANVTFEYGLTTAYGSSAVAAESPANGVAATPMSAMLTGLVPGATYHYRVSAVNAGGLTSGWDGTFVTPSSVTTLSGLVLSTGALSPAFSSATTDYTQTVPNATTSLTVKPTATNSGATLLLNGAAIASGSTSGPIPLERGPNAITVQVTAEDGVAMQTYTVNVTRTTPPPTVVTLQADNVSKTGATLHGTVNAENTLTNVSFDYGLTAAYGSSAAAPESPVSGSSVTPMTAVLTGLLPGRIYHYRVSAQNIGGTTKGLDAMFTTIHEDVFADLMPTSTSSASATPVVLHATGLIPGESVIVERFVDADADGVVDAGEFLAEKFTVTDGQVTSFGGVRNIHMPGDEDGAADGQVSIHINPALGPELGRLAGAQIIRVSSPTAAFPSLISPLAITHPPKAQSIAGTVTDGSNPVPHASVVLLHAGDSGEFALGAVANAAGQFMISAPVGSYKIFAVKGGFVDGPDLVTLGSGDALTQNIQVAAVTTSISGAVADAGTSAGLGGVQLFFESQTGQVAFTSSNVDGTFSLPVSAGQWQVSASEISLGRIGYVSLNEQVVGITADTTSSAVTGVNINVPKVTALIHGTVADSGANPLAGIRLGASDASHTHDSSAMTDADGRYVLGVTAGTWDAHISSDSPGLAGYVVPNGQPVTIASAQAVLAGFTLITVAQQITGSVKDTQDNPIVGVEVFGSAMLGGVGYSASAVTNAVGNYSLPVFSGTWNVGVSNSDLQAQGYLAPSNQSVTVGAAPVTLSFIALQATATITGFVKDAQNNPISGVQVFGTATVGGAEYSTSAITGASGNYSLPVFSSTWNVGVSNSDLQAQGYLAPSNQSVMVGAAPVTLSFIAPQTTTSIAGSVKDAQNNPVSGVRVSGSATLGGDSYSSSAVTNASGLYSLPVFSGSWTAGLSSDELLTRGYLSPPDQFSVVSVAPVVLNFIAPQATATIAGSVKDTQDNPIVGVEVFGSAMVGGIGYSTSAVTNAVGNYSLPVFSGTWNVGVSADGLQAQGYLAPSNQSVLVNSGTASLNFSVGLSSNANLASLVLSAGTLSPVFTGATTVYTVTVSNSTSSLTVTPTMSNSAANSKVNGITVTSGSVSSAINLDVGANTITVVGVAQNGTTMKTYTINVTRSAPEPAPAMTPPASDSPPASEATTAAKARLTAPAAGSTLTSDSATFHWDAGIGVGEYRLRVGSSAAGGDIYSASQGQALARSLGNLPTDGREFFVTLDSNIDGAWQGGTYSFIAWTKPAPLKARLTGPAANGGVLPGAGVTFTWDPGQGVSEYWLSIGTVVAGTDLYDVGQGATHARTVTLPTDGSDLYVTLKSKIDGAWLANNYVFAAADTSSRAVLTAPADQTKLGAPDATFAWNEIGGASEYWLSIGSTEGGTDVYDASQGAALSRTLSLPTDGRELFVTLKTRLEGAWASSSSTLFASGSGAPVAAQITSPANHSALNGASVTFTWDAGSGVSEYWLSVGTDATAADVFSASQGQNQSATLIVPADGSPLYITLNSLIDGKWRSSQYFYDAAVAR